MEFKTEEELIEMGKCQLIRLVLDLQNEIKLLEYAIKDNQRQAEKVEDDAKCMYRGKWELNNFTKEELIDMYINIYDAQTRAENAIDFLEMAKQSLEEEVERLKQRDYQGVLQNICETLKEIRDILKRR